MRHAIRATLMKLAGLMSIYLAIHCFMTIGSASRGVFWIIVFFGSAYIHVMEEEKAKDKINSV